MGQVALFASKAEREDALFLLLHLPGISTLEVLKQVAFDDSKVLNRVALFIIQASQ